MVSLPASEAAVNGWIKKQCAYCSGDMPPVPGMGRLVSHGICEGCAGPLEAIQSTGESQIKPCASCGVRIGAWRATCAPCAELCLA